jgi:plastocyanin
MLSQRFRRLLIPVALSALMVLGSCANDDEPEATPTETSTAEESPTASPDVAVTGADYSFTGIGETIDAGAKVTFKNASTKEAHEIVAFKLPDSETRPAADIFKLPEAELNAALGGPPVFVIVAPPASDGMAVVGDGTLTDPGRYAFACFIPTDADPDEYMKAAQESGDEAPVVAGGPPHFVQGMFAEATVE